MADSAGTPVAEKIDSYIGSLICLITKSEIRYEGFMFHLDSMECIIGLRNVKSFGTEGRRKDGPEVSPSEGLFEYLYFRGSDIKDLQVLSASPAQSTSALPDDPAIIQQHQPHLQTATNGLVSPSAFQATNLNSNTQSGVGAPPFQGNLPSNQSVRVSVCRASMAPPPPPVNVSGPPLAKYWPQFTRLAEGTSFSQQPSFSLPPPTQGFVLTNTIQQPMQHLSRNVSLAGSASNITEAPCPLLPPVCTGSRTLIVTLAPPSSVQYSNIPHAPLFSNLTTNKMHNTAFGALPTALVNSSSEAAASCSATKSDVNPLVPPVTQTGQSLFGRAPFSITQQAVSRTVGAASISDDKTLIKSHARLLPGFLESSSSHYLMDGNDDTNIILTSASDSQSSDYENTKEAAPQLPKALNIKMHEPASSSRYFDRRHLQDQGVGMHQSNRGHGHVRGGRGNLPNRAYQSYRGYSFERGNTITGAPLHPHHHNIRPRRGYPITGAPLHPHHHNIRPRRGYPLKPTWYPHHNVRVHQEHEGGSKASPSVTRFTKDFDFEAMNQRFNKEEVWGHLGKGKSDEAEYGGRGDREGNASDAKDEAGDVLPKLEQPIYCKDDFFDSISCRSLDVESGRGKMKVSEQRKIDTETFGEIPKPRQDRSIMGPHRGRNSWGFYRGPESGIAGRGRGIAGRGRPANYWNRMS